jgi:hypothetical protein
VNGLRLTRRGRLLVQTFPIFLVLVIGTQAVAHRAGRPPADAVLSAAVPTSAAPTPRAVPSGAPAAVTPAATRTATRPPAATRPPRPARTVSTGRLTVVPGRSAVHGSGPLRRFVVETEAGLPDDP